MTDRQSSSSPDLRLRLDFDDGKLLAECEIHLHRTGGPGGQHRNKVSSAVRLRHRPSGLVVNASERRSQHENKAKALHRLREALAINVRAPLPARPNWPEGVQIVEGTLRINPKNPALCHALALVLDAIAEHRGRTPDAARWLGITPSSLNRFLGEHPKALAEAHRLRQGASSSPW